MQIGDITRRIILKVIDKKARVKAAKLSSFQMGNGIRPGSEALIHALRKAISLPRTKCLLLLDATNAYGELK